VAEGLAMPDNPPTRTHISMRRPPLNGETQSLGSGEAYAAKLDGSLRMCIMHA
jgi:hypothetical protein